MPTLPWRCSSQAELTSGSCSSQGPCWLCRGDPECQRCLPTGSQRHPSSACTPWDHPMARLRATPGRAHCLDVLQWGEAAKSAEESRCSDLPPRPPHRTCRPLPPTLVPSLRLLPPHPPLCWVYLLAPLSSDPTGLTPSSKVQLRCLLLQGAPRNNTLVSNPPNISQVTIIYFLVLLHDLFSSAHSICKHTRLRNEWMDE